MKIGFHHKEVLAFGFVGGCATVAHYVVALAVDYLFAPSIFLCNLIGFLVAFSVSYFGHYYLSFRSDAPHLQALPRFIIAALFGFLMNNFVLLILVWVSGAELMWFIAVAMVASAGSVFLVSKFWSFASQGVRET